MSKALPPGCCNARVLAVSTDGETVTHTTDAPLPEGTEVTGCLNWAARLDAMQQHTGEHILSGTLHRLFGAENVGFHIGSPYVRMDTSIPLTAAQLAEAEAEANAAVRADTPVRCWVPDPEALGGRRGCRPAALRPGRHADPGACAPAGGRGRAQGPAGHPAEHLGRCLRRRSRTRRTGGAVGGRRRR